MGLLALKPRKSWARGDEMVIPPAHCLPALVNVCSYFLLVDRRQTAGSCSELTKDGTVSLACGLINWKRSRILQGTELMGLDNQIWELNRRSPVDPRFLVSMTR